MLTTLCEILAITGCITCGITFCNSKITSNTDEKFERKWENKNAEIGWCYQKTKQDSTLKFFKNHNDSNLISNYLSYIF